MADSCRNSNRSKYYCQDRHRKGECADEAVRAECAASCSCPDDHYSPVPGAHASARCAPPRAYPTTQGTLVVVNSHADSPFAARARSGFGATGVRTLLVYGGALAASFAATNASNASSFLQGLTDGPLMMSKPFKSLSCATIL